MNWNWLGWLLWIGAIAFLFYVFHYIRVKQLMLIAKTGKRYQGNLVVRYIGLLVIALCWIGVMAYLSFFRQVDYHNNDEVTISTKYQPLRMMNQGKSDDFYYVRANRSTSGQHPVVSYTYWTSDEKHYTNSKYSSIADSNSYITTVANSYPWDKKRLKQEDQRTARAFAAVMTIKYKNNFLNGLGCRAGHQAEQYTLIRVPASDMIHQK